MSSVFATKAIAGRLDATARGPRYLGLGVRLADPTALRTVVDLAEPLALACRVDAVLVQRSRTHPGLVAFQFQLDQRYWMTCTARDVAGPGVGITEGRRQIPFALDPPHAGIFGTTRSGKSVAVDTIIRGLLLTHTPDDLQLVLCDPHADHLAFDRSAHLALPVATTAEEIGQALEYAGQVLAQRRAARDRQASRLIVVVDEAQQVLIEERNLAIIQAIAAEAAKFRVHLILATQKPMERNMPNILTNLGNRWVGLVQNAQTSATLTGQAGLGCHRLTGHGDFVHVAGGMVDMERLQVAFLHNTDFDTLPRAPEAADWPTIEHADTPPLLNMPASKPAPGRPARVVEPDQAAVYYHYGPDAISITQAAEQLGLSRRGHDQYKDWVTRFTQSLTRLQEVEHE